MRCNMTPILRQAYLDAGDARIAAHVATCPECQAELAALANVERSLNALPDVTVPASLRARMAQLADATQGQALDCAATLDLLEPYREGDLDAATTFLVEDHILACHACEIALAQSEALAGALRTLPALTPPAVIAERIAAARVPWWQKLFPAPRVAWRVGFATAGLALLMLAGQQAPRVMALLPHQQPRPVVVPSHRDDTLVTRPISGPSVDPKPAQKPTPVVQPVEKHPAPVTVRRPKAKLPKPNPQPNTGGATQGNTNTNTKTPTPVESPAPVYTAAPDVEDAQFRDAIYSAGDANSAPSFPTAAGPATADPMG